MIGKKINQLATELAPVSTDLTIIGDPISGVSKKITLAQLGAIFSGAVSFYTNLAGFPATGDINVIYCAKDTQKLYLWSGSAYVEVFPSQALLDTYQLRSEKGNANGYASLDSAGKVPISQLPSSIMEYKGTWNAATNTPTLANGTGDTGDVYICNVAGTVNFGAGPITFAVGDYTIYSGSIWQRSSGAVGTVTSVAASITGNAIGITGSPVTTSGTLAFAFAGTGAQYIKGDGTLATFPNTIAQATNLITEVYNSTGATLTKGTIVYINGGQGNLPTVTKAIATGDSTSAQTFGVVQADITNNNNGYVVVAGKLSDLDTQAYTEGTQLYLSSTTAGTWTSTKQYAPNHLVYIGIVVRAHPTQGIVEIKIQNGYEMDELHNVSAQSPDNNDILQYKTSTSLWTKVAGTTSNIAEGSNLYYTDARSRAALSFTAGSGAYNSTTGVITIPTNTNQLTNGANYITLASLSAGAGISYNNTTGVIASTITQYTDAMARASISLTTTGTSGAATYNSTTGVLNVPQYAPDLSGYVPTSRTLTINGTAYDLSANRSWSVGTVTSVGLSSATSGVSIGSTPVTTSGTITLAIATASGSQQGLLSSTDWTTFNNKQNALTNPVTGTGTTNYIPKLTGTSTIGNSVIQENSGSIGINGAATPNSGDTRLQVNGSTYSSLFTFSTNIQGIFRSHEPNSVLYIGTITNHSLSFLTNDTERMRLNASGNLGLGVTPSAWSGFTALQVQNSSLSTTGSDVFLNANCFFNGSNWRYIASAAASQYYQDAGSSIWRIAPSGTAGNAISFTQAMTLFSDGNLALATTSNAGYKLDVNGTGRFSDYLQLNSSTYARLDMYGASGYGNQIRFGDGTTLKAAIRQNYNVGEGLEFYSGGLALANLALYIHPSGNISLGNTNNTYKLDVSGAGNFGGGVIISGNASISSTARAIWGNTYLQFNSGSSGISWNNSNNTTGLMLLNASGNLSIGNTNDTYKLDVSGTGSFTTAGNPLRLNSTSNDVWATFTPQTGNVWRLQARTTSDFIIYNETLATFPLTIASTGAATFSSSITAGGDILVPYDGTDRFIGSRFSGTYYNGFVLNGGTRSTGIVSRSGDATDYIWFGTNAATERMRITNAGLVGIGTSSPARLLDVNGTMRIADGSAIEWGGVSAAISGTSASNALLFYTSSAERLRITSGGNVGIGLTNPTAILHTAGNTKLGGGAFQVSTDQTFISSYSYTFRDAVGINNPNSLSAASATTVMSIGSMTNGVSLITTGAVGIGTTSPATFGKLAVAVSGTGSKAGIGISNAGYNGTNASPIEIGLLELFSSGGTAPTGIYGLNTYNDNSASWLAFKTTNTAGTTSTAMTITSGGNVGIGTTSPNGKLTLSYSSALVDGLIFSNTATNGRQWRIGDGSGASAGVFGIYDATAAATRMVITSTGEVEIGSSFKTGEPDTGYGRAAFKIGSRQTGSATGTGGYIPISIDGTVYFINLYTSTP